MSAAEVVAPDDDLVLWMTTGALERIWDGHQTGASSYQVANGKFDGFINPLVLKSTLDASRAETAAANARADALSVRCADLSDDLRGEEMVRRFIEAKLAKAVEALRRLDEATAISTNSESADRAFSFVHAVAATALTEIEGKSS